MGDQTHPPNCHLDEGLSGWLSTGPFWAPRESPNPKPFELPGPPKKKTVNATVYAPNEKGNGPRLEGPGPTKVAIGSVEQNRNNMKPPVLDEAAKYAKAADDFVGRRREI